MTFCTNLQMAKVKANKPCHFLRMCTSMTTSSLKLQIRVNKLVWSAITISRKSLTKILRSVLNISIRTPISIVVQAILQYPRINTRERLPIGLRLLRNGSCTANNFYRWTLCLITCLLSPLKTQPSNSEYLYHR